MSEANSKANKSLAYAAEVLDQAFFGTPIAWAPHSGAWLLNLHSGDPINAAGNPAHRLAYAGYQPQRLPRNAATWQRDGDTVRNRIDIRFALCQTGGPARATHWSMTPEGESRPRYTGELAAPLAIAPGTRPVVDAGGLSISES